MEDVKITKRWICDDCGRSTDISNALGWVKIKNPPHLKGLDKHYCPLCARKERPHGR